jgi:uncharacterized protein YajQ (UPF0234 family)
MAVAEQAKAAVQARYIVAQQNRRDLDDVRVRLLKECKRPSFAKVARYLKPVGKGVEGPSIRFAEAAIRTLGNIFVETPTVFDDAEKQIVRCTVTDLEANITYMQDIIVEKTVERSKLKEGQIPLGSRTNSQGRTTYLVAATEDDLLNKRAALISKAIRTLGLRVLPGDILDECMQLCIATAEQEDARDPSAAQKAVADAFAQLNITPADLAKYLDHPLASATPAEIGELRAVWSALRDGEGSWSDVLAMKHPADANDKAPPNEKAEALKTKLEERKAAAASSKKAPTATPKGSPLASATDEHDAEPEPGTAG